MKSKVYIISEIRKLLEQNRGFCEEEIEQWVADNGDMTICKLLEFKGDLMKGKQYRDVSCMSWFREEEQ
jgi:hypothetical protein|tara:strand:+ start:994 stop:1200 length:207 start_codon:yes stop_codon:yes gene_type:complete